MAALRRSAMKSPFPGMDPYLERHWRDVHARLIIYACDRIQEQLPSGLRCRVEERVVLELPAGAERSMYPDIRVIERANGSVGPQGVAEAALAVAEPLILHLASEELTETFLEIVDVSTGQRVITVIEVLSPTNKLGGDGRDQYFQKKKELRQAGVSLVEIDLLRAGERPYPVNLRHVPETHRTHYAIFVRRGSKPNQAEIYAASLRQPLPTIKIPLRPTDVDALLDLQPLIEKCYRNGRYEDMDYTQPPDPPLDDADRSWAEALVLQRKE